MFEIFSYFFMVKAFVVGVCIAVAMSLLGVILVLKRYSMIGDGLSHVSFSAYTIALTLNVVPILFAIPVVIISSIFLMWLGNSGKLKGDAAIALISTSFLSIGIVIVSLTTGMNTDVLGFMFGSVLAINNFDLILTVVCSITVILIFLFFYNKFFAVTFDEDFTKAVGIKVSFYSNLIAILVAVMIVIGMKMVGALLVSSLIVFPALSSMRVFKTFRLVALNSVVVSSFCFTLGLILSYFYSLPTGATVVLVNLAVFLLYCVVGHLRKN